MAVKTAYSTRSNAYHWGMNWCALPTCTRRQRLTEKVERQIPSCIRPSALRLCRLLLSALTSPSLGERLVVRHSTRTCTIRRMKKSKSSKRSLKIGQRAARMRRSRRAPTASSPISPTPTTTCASPGTPTRQPFGRSAWGTSRRWPANG